jgi:hypothetical protein
MATGNHIPTISAAQGAMYYDTNGAAIDFSTALNGLVTAPEQVIQCKDVSVGLPQTESEQVPLLGTTSTTAGTGVLNTGVYQNATKDFKNTTNGTVSGTLILTLGNDGASPSLPDFLDLATGAGLAISTTHHRHTFGDSTTAQTQVLTGVIFVIFDNGVTAGTVALLNPTVNLGEIKPTGSDGHWEVEFTANTLPCDFALEVEDQD